MEKRYQEEKRRTSASPGGKDGGGELLDVSCSHADNFVTSANAECHTEL